MEIIEQKLRKEIDKEEEESKKRDEKDRNDKKITPTSLGRLYPIHLWNKW